MNQPGTTWCDPEYYNNSYYCVSYEYSNWLSCYRPLSFVFISKHNHSAWGYNCFACDFATAVQWAGPPYHDHWSGSEVVGMFL